MSSEQKKIYVYDSFSREEDVVLGCLYVDHIRGSESYSFEYDNDWLSKSGSFIGIDPGMQFFPGRQFPADGELFGSFKDAAPDRWGRTLMNRRERLLAEQEGRKPDKLQESDYLLGVYDETRMGGLRFKTEKEGHFLSSDDEVSVPPWIRLRSLEEASRNFESEEGGLQGKWIDNLLKPGSSLGGARPKASVEDEKGDLWIAKFPSRYDDNNIGAWEKITIDMAGMCGLNVPEVRLENYSEHGSTFLSRRFDRKAERRIHYASCMTLLRKKDGASAHDGTSYLDIADFIRSHGSRPKADLEELWKRIVFSMAVSNTDDHLRNHAFIFSHDGWMLSPMFDVNPVPYGNELALNVDEWDNSISLELAIETAPKFGISRSKAEDLAGNIVRTVNTNWERLAKKYELTRTQIEHMRPAFGLKL